MSAVAEQGVADLIGVLRARWPGHPVYLCGGSMGGSSTLIFALRRPELIAGALALCPVADVESFYASCRADDSEVTRNIASAIEIHYTAGERVLADELRARSAVRNAERLTMPLYIAHGDADPLVPVGPVRELVARLRELGRPARYVELADGGHDTPVIEVDWHGALDFIEHPDADGGM